MSNLQINLLKKLQNLRGDMFFTVSHNQYVIT